ncbi:MAG: PAS domain-containing protein [Bacteroidia bacterium]|nr:PAS domain-containing protein [Bacteroidia bacterium]
MTNQKTVEEIFFKFLMQYQFDVDSLDYSLIETRRGALQTLSEISNSGINVFDISKREVVFYSSNFGKLLGYSPLDYEKMGQKFFIEKMHPEDLLKLSSLGVSILKLFNSFPLADKLNHKMIQEYRMLNAENKYVRLIEQYQMIELDNKGQIWLMMGVVDVSPNQEEFNGIKCQLLNFKTGQFVPYEPATNVQIELTKREMEILKLVKEGLLSKEISNKLSISLHTVNTHRQRFLAKLGANNSLEALMFATKFGLLD